MFECSDIPFRTLFLLSRNLAALGPGAGHVLGSMT